MALLFAREARRHFDAAAQQFGLNCIASNEREVRYENDQVFLKINFDKDRSYEVNVELGKKDVRYSGPPFSLSEVLRLRGVQDAISEDAIAASNDQRLQAALARLAELTVKHAADFLTGSDFSFAQLAKFRSKECIEYELAAKLRHARAAAEAAWQAHDYASIVKVLTPLVSSLSPAEKKMLDYSRKKLAP